MQCTFIIISVLIISATVPLQPAHGANILGLFLSPSPSHQIVHMSVMKALAERGHNITVVALYDPPVNHAKIRTIIIPPPVEQERKLNEIMSSMSSKKTNIFILVKNMFTSNRILFDMQLHAMRDERFSSLYDMPDTKFDLVIMGYFFNDFKLAAAAKFKCPVIISWMGPPMSTVDAYIGNPGEVAYVPNFNMVFEHGKPMNFAERVQNFLSSLAFQGVTKTVNYFMQQYYNDLLEHDANYPTFKEMQQNVSLAFCNSHSLSEGPIRPLVPALVEIGGIQIKEKPDALPKDLNDFINTANKTGAILFSLGSNLKSSNIKPEIVKTIFNTLASLQQKVIWKWDDLQNTPGTAKNIFYSKWLPQDDILAHPNLKLFITHAGKGGVAEAQYHGVPMVALPVFADQHTNADKLVKAGYGVQVDILHLKADELKTAILEVLTNPIYKEKIMKFSQLYRDRPLTAKQTAVFWTEYVIRHHGAVHMQSPLVFLNALQSNSVDVILFLCAVLYIVWKLVKFLYKTVRKILRLLLTTQKRKSKRD